MLSFLDVSTAYFATALMYLLMPLLVWSGLRKAHHASVTLWTTGGAVFGAGLLLLAMRAHLPSWVSYEVGNSLMAIGSLLRLQGLNLLQDKPYSTAPMVVVGLTHILGYMAARQLLDPSPLFFIWTLLFVALEFGLIAFLAHRIGNTQNIRSIQWMSIAYIPMIALLLIRAGSALFMSTDTANIIYSSAVSTGIALMGLVTAVVSNTSFLAMFVERTAHEREDAIMLNAQRKATENLARQISELDRQRSRHSIAAALSHELGQPMTGIKLMTDLWHSNPQAINASDVLTQIHHSIDSAVNILGRMRSLSKSETIELQSVDLLLVHNQVMLLIQDWLQIEKVNVSLRTNQTPATVQGDPVLLSQILINLYRNAVQASSNQATHQLDVDIQVTPSQVTLSVHDNGPGFSPQALDQTTQSRLYSSKEEGLGIGLSIVRTIIEQHHGQLILGNHPEGGALVQIVLMR